MRHLRLVLPVIAAFFFFTPGIAQNIYPFGGGFTVQGIVKALEYDAAHDRLYIGGAFTAVEGVEANNIAVLENGVWKPLGNGINGTVYCIQHHGDDLYTGGYFDKAGDVSANNVARWDGQIWYSMKGGTEGFSYISDLEWHNDLLYASGTFNKIGGADATYLASWDGNDWNGCNFWGKLPPRGLKSHHDTLWAWGSAYQSLQGFRHLVSYYDGTTWDTLPLPAPDEILSTSFAIQDDQIFITTVFAGKIYKWDSAQWTEIPVSNNMDKMLVSYQNELYVFHDSSYTDDIFLIRKLVNNDLGPVLGWIGQPLEFQLPVATQAGNALWIGGNFSYANDQAVASLTTFENGQWSTPALVAGTGYQDPWINATGIVLMQDSITGDILAGGDFLFADHQFAPSIARWDGVQWHPMGEGFNGRVRKLIRYNGDLYAFGTFTRSGNTVLGNMARWDGSQWVPFGSTDGPVRDVLIKNGNLYVCGEFEHISGIAAPIAKYNGSFWSPVSTSPPFASGIYDIEFFENQLLAATGYNGVLRLVNNNWQLMGGFETIFLLHLFDGKLYAGGNGFGPAVHLWDGTDWVSAGLENDAGNGASQFVEMRGDLFCTVANDGLYHLKNGVWTHLSYLQPYSVLALNNDHYLVTGFFPWLYIDLRKRVFNHLAILDFSPPQVEISADKDTLCSHQYVFFRAEHDALFINYQWHFPGGFPDTSSQANPIVQYLTPGVYPAWVMISNLAGADSVQLDYPIVVNLCVTNAEEVNDAVVSLQLFPNPAKDVLRVTSRDAVVLNAAIINTVGQIVVHWNGVGDVIELAALPPGLYYIQVLTDKGLAAGEFVKQ